MGMKSLLRRLAGIPLHPLLFGIYPVLSLWYINIDQVAVYAILRTLLVSFGLAMVCYLAAAIIFRRWNKAAIFSSLLLVLFFTYGHMLDLVDKATIFGFLIGRRSYLLALWGLILVLVAVFLWRTKSELKTLNQALMLMSVFLVLMVLVQVGLYAQRALAASQPATPAGQGSTSSSVASTSSSVLTTSSSVLTTSSTTRDVYYIVIDSYTRHDFLLDRYGVDNQEFLNQLIKLGFVIPNCAQSNYTSTVLAISSTLNMNYLDTLGIPLDPTTQRIKLYDFEYAIKQSLVRKEFKNLGYQFITFKAEHPVLEITDSDIHYDSQEDLAYINKLESLNFEKLFYQTTLLRLGYDWFKASHLSPEQYQMLPPLLAQFFDSRIFNLINVEYQQYNENLYALDKLEKIPQLSGRKFIYAHLFITHQPLVFTPAGDFRWPVEDTDDAYGDAVRYADNRMISVIKDIIDSSPVPPIIILQGDHGMIQNENRSKILNAYYLPDGGGQKVYPTITPVNSFRLIFDFYFGGKYDLLPDNTNYSPVKTPYQFVSLPESCVQP